MQQIDVSSWEHFEDQLHRLLGGHTSPPGEGHGHVSGFLYRGQADSGWELATTLERSDTRNLSLRQYYRLMLAVKPQVETVTDTEWSAPGLADYEKWLIERQHMAIAPLGYEYMVYLRHHGFPSPLLDWTRSPYIAAHFAFRRSLHDAKSVAIFVYREYLGGGKSWVSSQPHLHEPGYLHRCSRVVPVLHLGWPVEGRGSVKHSGAIALVTCLILVIIWWNWPDWGRRGYWEYWFPLGLDRRAFTIAGCQRGQLTTMRPEDGGSVSAVALNDLAALAVFDKPMDLLDSRTVAARLEHRIANIHRKADRFFALVEQGHVIRVPEKKLVRYMQPSEFADWIVEVEVFRQGDSQLRGFAHWKDLDCWSFK